MTTIRTDPILRYCPIPYRGMVAETILRSRRKVAQKAALQSLAECRSRLCTTLCSGKCSRDAGLQSLQSLAECFPGAGSCAHARARVRARVRSGQGKDSATLCTLCRVAPGAGFRVQSVCRVSLKTLHETLQSRMGSWFKTLQE